VYPSSLVPGKWRVIYELNPLVGIIENFRASLFGQPFDWQALTISSIVTLTLLIYSAFAFRRLEKSFADIV
jgi:lipopolysaccharide transport system permease protein